MTMPGRDTGEIEALVTDHYLDALLAGEADLLLLDPPGSKPRATVLDAAVRAASRRLAADLPRFHPSFRFEERLALRLAEAAAAMRLPVATGSEAEAEVPRIAIAGAAPRPTGGTAIAGGLDPLAVLPDEDEGDPLRAPLIVRGAVAASALSLAGAAWYAWRHRPSASPMARAARAAHGARPARRQLSGRV